MVGFLKYRIFTFYEFILKVLIDEKSFGEEIHEEITECLDKNLHDSYDPQSGFKTQARKKVICRTDVSYEHLKILL
jgi:hypothetical protein